MKSGSIEMCTCPVVISDVPDSYCLKCDKCQILPNLHPQIWQELALELDLRANYCTNILLGFISNSNNAMLI